MKRVTVALLLVVAAAGCRTVSENCPENQWTNIATLAGGALAAAGPAVAIGGIALDDQPATPPVEAFAIGAGLTVAGVTTVIVAGALSDDKCEG